VFARPVVVGVFARWRDVKRAKRGSVSTVVEVTESWPTSIASLVILKEAMLKNYVSTCEETLNQWNSSRSEKKIHGRIASSVGPRRSLTMVEDVRHSSLSAVSIYVWW
jgi:hypothetical protein